MREMNLQLFGGGGGRSGARPRVSKQTAGIPEQVLDASFEESVALLERLERDRKEAEAKANKLKKESYEHMGRSKADREAYERITDEMRLVLLEVYQHVEVEALLENFLKDKFPKEFEKYRKSRQGEKTKTRSAYNPNQGGASRGF